MLDGDRFSRRAFASLIPLILTAIIALGACLSSYFSYRSIEIASEMKQIQSREEIFGYIKEFIEMAGKFSKEKQGQPEDTASKRPIGVGPAQ